MNAALGDQPETHLPEFLEEARDMQEERSALVTQIAVERLERQSSLSKEVQALEQRVTNLESWCYELLARLETQVKQLERLEKQLAPKDWKLCSFAPNNKRI
eukprot:TRINITY_DN11516_c0_g1_i1.p1 TRINITY_DN11516_c0_g1~~TRINITY_DN11516_c0_g1_i1.p1  ORF type:complete len:102 (+),score=10.64 TRINITY_DN11516_c0_g1_i1:58-363(+)